MFIHVTSILNCLDAPLRSFLNILNKLTYFDETVYIGQICLVHRPWNYCFDDI